MYAAYHDRYRVCGACQHRRRSKSIYLHGKRRQRLCRKHSRQLFCYADHRFPHLNCYSAFRQPCLRDGFWSQWKHHRICRKLYEHLCDRNYFCTADSRNEFLHYRTRLCENRNVFCPDRSCHQHYFRSDFYFRIPLGCTWRCSRYNPLTDLFLYLGSFLPFRKKDNP